MLLKKIDKDTGEVIPHRTGSLKGAEFVFKFIKESIRRTQIRKHWERQ